MIRSPNLCKILHWCVGAAVVGVLALLVAAAVPQRVTAQDEAALTSYGIVLPTERRIPATRDEQGQIEFLRALERRVHGRVTRIRAIPKGQPREPADVLAAATGVCFDRARVLEQAARLAGFEARRSFLLYGPDASTSVGGIVKRFAHPGGPTHTLVEVKVGSHWVFLGTLTPVIGVDASGRMWSVKALSHLPPTERKSLQAQERWKEILETPFVPIQGLYNRHGQHYWPYAPFPNYAPGQVLSALTERADDSPARPVSAPAASTGAR